MFNMIKIVHQITSFKTKKLQLLRGTSYLRQPPPPPRRATGASVVLIDANVPLSTSTIWPPLLWKLFCHLWLQHRSGVMTGLRQKDIWVFPGTILSVSTTVFVPIPAHAPITAHQRHFQFKICGTINCPLKSSHPVASDYVPSPVLNTENHQLRLC